MADPFIEVLPELGEEPWNLNPAIEEIRGRVLLHEEEFVSVITPEQFGAKGDGVTDDYLAIEEALASAVPGSLVWFASRYATSQPVSLSGKTRVVVSGGEIVFTHSTSPDMGASAFFVTNCTDSIIENMRLEQDPATQTRKYSGLTIRESDGVIARNVIAYNFRWVGQGATSNSKNITFDSGQGIRCYVGGFSDNTTSYVKFLGGRYSSEWSETQEFVDKGGVWDPSSRYYDGIIVGGSRWVIDSVTLDNNGQSGIFGDGGNLNGVMSNCVVTGNWNKGIDFGKTNGLPINNLAFLGNVVSNNATGDIHFSEVTDSIISHNIVVTTGTFGIGLNGASVGNIVSGNILKSAVVNPAIFADALAVNNTFTGNQIGAPTPYTLGSPSSNVVSYSSGGARRFEALVEIDRTKNTGFAGRAVLSLLASADNSAAQVLSNKPISVTLPDGSYQGFRAGAGTFQSIFVDITGSLSLPRTAQTAEGAVWYDAATQKLRFRDATGTRTVTST